MKLRDLCGEHMRRICDAVERVLIGLVTGKKWPQLAREADKARRPRR